MRTTAGGRTVASSAGLGPRAETGTRRRTSATSSPATTGGVTRPSMATVPGREKKSAATGTSPVGTGGWAGYRKAKTERGSEFPRLEVDDKTPVVIRFAEAEPFAFIYRHWLNKKPFTCIGDECPMCEAQDKAKPVVFYNVITAEDATLRVWELTSEPTRKVQKHYDALAEKDKTLDDPGLYFVVSKAKKDNGFFKYNVEKVRATDLEDEGYGEPLGDDEIADAIGKKGLFTDAIVRVHTKKDLRDALEDADD